MYVGLKLEITVVLNCKAQKSHEKGSAARDTTQNTGHVKLNAICIYVRTHVRIMNQNCQQKDV